MPAYPSTQTPSRTETVITVSALNHAVAQLLERNFPLTWVSGEISNFTRATSGHWYFTLKDSGAQVRAVMFRGRSQYADFMPREGDKVEVRALVGLYTPRGDYQINVEAIRRAGVGNLFEAFLQLKAKLEAEGLFDQTRKRALPHFVKKIAIVTSPQAAALRDVLSTLQRRAPHIEVHIFPCPVQGEGAAAKIAQAIASVSAEIDAHEVPTYDLLLLCRGGGSIEDLWAFNEEILARTIAHSAIPVICGVGHETDFTIADFVADLRAPTPTAAAEMAATPRVEWLKSLSQLQAALQNTWRRQLETKAQSLDLASHRLLSPAASIASKRQQIEHSARCLRFAGQLPVRAAQARLAQLHTRLRHQRPQTAAVQPKLANLAQQMQRKMKEALLRQTTALINLQSKLELLNPQRTLERGYVILRSEDGQLVRAGSELAADQTISLRTAVDFTEIQIKSVAKIPD